MGLHAYHTLPVPCKGTLGHGGVSPHGVPGTHLGCSTHLRMRPSPQRSCSMLHLGSIVTSSQLLPLSDLFVMLDVGGRGGQGHGGTPCPSLPGPPAASLRLAREPCDADGPSRPAWPEWTAAACPLQPWARRGGAVSGVRGAPSDHLQRRPSSPGASLASRGACRPRPPHCPWDAGAAPRRHVRPLARCRLSPVSGWKAQRRRTGLAFLGALPVSRADAGAGAALLPAGPCPASRSGG